MSKIIKKETVNCAGNDLTLIVKKVENGYITTSKFDEDINFEDFYKSERLYDALNIFKGLKDFYTEDDY